MIHFQTFTRLWESRLFVHLELNGTSCTIYTIVWIVFRQPHITVRPGVNHPLAATESDPVL